MKKLLAVALGMLFVFGFAVSAFAIHAEIPSETQAVVAKGQTQITLGGEIRIRGEYRKNIGRLNDDFGDNTAYYDQRVRLRLQADVTKNTTGVVHLETGSTDVTDTFTWGQSTVGVDNAGGKGIYTRGNSKRGELRVLEAWIQHTGSGLLGIPAGLKVGHMPLALGNKLFFDHTKFGDDAIVFFMDPTKELHVGLLTAKFGEGVNTVASASGGVNNNDDANAYVLLFNYKATKDVTISGDATYVNDQKYGIDTDASVQSATKGTGLWNFGLRGDVNVSGVGLKADIEVQSGKSKNIRGTTTSISHRGVAYLLGASYKLAPVKISLEYAYGSGDNNDTDTKNKTFVTALGADQHYTYVYEYRTATAAGSAGTGLANTWYLKLGGEADLAKDLSGALNIYYLRAVKGVNIMDAKDGAGADKLSKKLGTEIDAKVTYKIDKNLQYWVEGGYLFAGAAFDRGSQQLGTHKGSDDAYAVRHGIQLNF